MKEAYFIFNPFTMRNFSVSNLVRIFYFFYAYYDFRKRNKRSIKTNLSRSR